MNRRLFAAAMLALTGWFAATGASASQPEDCTTTAASISYLLHAVENSTYLFIRNGQSHSGQDAADHMRAKYGHFEDRIQRPDDFIELAATRSLLTGTAYQVETASGQTLPTAAWLRALLATCQTREAASE